MMGSTGYPPSATYSLPSGPNTSPRGLTSPVANTVAAAAAVVWTAAPFAAWALMGPPPRTTAPTHAMKADRHDLILKRVIRLLRIFEVAAGRANAPGPSLLPPARGPSRMAGRKRRNAACLL